MELRQPDHTRRGKTERVRSGGFRRLNHRVAVASVCGGIPACSRSCRHPRTTNSSATPRKEHFCFIYPSHLSPGMSIEIIDIKWIGYSPRVGIAIALLKATGDPPSRSGIVVTQRRTPGNPSSNGGHFNEHGRHRLVLTSAILVLGDDDPGPGLLLRRPRQEKERPFYPDAVLHHRLMISLLWVLFGYSLAFGPDTGWGIIGSSSGQG